ncbi:MAG: RNA ligase [Thiohalorhabdus sp.]|uniref:RNA ligase n=1 Tax=Thiohalorhabdus sp. TaxID=3094134 RepID=UPI0039811936
MPTLPLREALRQGRAVRARFGGLRYIRFKDDFQGVPRGTVVARGRTVWGYPHMGRLLSLEAGLEEHFAGPFQAEEKIDGYNVRIARLGGRPVALTRGGLVCPFTTDRLPDLLPTAILDAEPERVVCGEVAGPDNPYLEASPPWIGADVALFVFDLMGINRPGFEPLADKHAAVERYALPAVPFRGRFRPDEAGRAGLRAVSDAVEAEGGEGVVLKEEDRPDKRVKYVTGGANIRDIAVAAGNMADLPADYFSDRVQRLVLYLMDQGRERTAELDRELGRAFLDGLEEAVRQFRRERHVSCVYRCRFRERANAEAFRRHLAALSDAGVQTRILGLEREGRGGYWVLRFERIAPRITGILGHLFRGGIFYDP